MTIVSNSPIGAAVYRQGCSRRRNPCTTANQRKPSPVGTADNSLAINFCRPHRTPSLGVHPSQGFRFALLRFTPA